MMSDYRVYVTKDNALLKDHDLVPIKLGDKIGFMSKNIYDELQAQEDSMKWMLDALGISFDQVGEDT